MAAEERAAGGPAKRGDALRDAGRRGRPGRRRGGRGGERDADGENEMALGLERAKGPIFRDYVLPYASANEPRTHWHGLLAKAVEPILVALPRHASISDVAEAINSEFWQNVGGVKFHSGQTPLIFDPVSTVAFGYASCTGVSTTYIAALRVAGVPARLVGTPAWLGDPAKGNHNWVELWDGASWRFWEGRPAGGGETLTNPCDKWFCKAARFPVNATKVYAARFDRRANQSIYPLAWDPSNLDTPGVDRTDAYVQMCSNC